MPDGDPRPFAPPTSAPIPWRRLATWFLVSRAAIWLVGGLSLLLVPKGSYFTAPASILDWFKHWDSQWYVRIAELGYEYDPARQSSVNFLPFYPLLMRAVAWLGPSVDVSAYLVSNGLTFLGAAILWRLTRELSDRDTAADYAVAFLFLGPVSLFFTAIYSEGTFFCCAIASVTLARQQRWLLAGVLGAAAALTRSVGLLLAIPLALEWFRRHPPGAAWHQARTWLRLGCCGLPALGSAAYVVFLGWRFGDPDAYLISHRHSGHHTGYPWAIFHTHHFGTLPLFYQIWFAAAVLAGVLLLLGCVVAGLPLSFTLFALALTILYLSIKSLEGTPRFFSVVFPFYCVLGVGGARWPRLAQVLLVVSAGLLVLSVCLFVNGYWFT